MIEIVHNFEPKKFKWLWAKYVNGVNDSRHCTHCIRGSYSKHFSKLNPMLSSSIEFEEQPLGSFSAVYICGVSSMGYTKHLNYPHNVHLAIQPEEGATDTWTFENWSVGIRNGRVLVIPDTKDLPAQYQSLPAEFTTCRIFRWAVCWNANTKSPAIRRGLG
jgi:hypothetical protein